MIHRTPPIAEAAQQILAKSSKLDVATDAVVIEDLRATAAEQREVTAAYQREKLKLKPGPMKRSGKADDMIVCDDYHVSNGSGLAGILAAMVAAAGITAAGMKYLQPPIPTLPPVEPAVVEIEVHSDAPPGTKFEFRVKK